MSSAALRHREQLRSPQPDSSSPAMALSRSRLLAFSPKSRVQLCVDGTNLVRDPPQNVSGNGRSSLTVQAEWQKDNKYIISGYRVPSHSYQSSIKSIFELHNETVNIHSHLFGGILFFLLPLYAFYEVYPRQPKAGFADIAVFAVFFYGVAVCFILSSIYHVVLNHSPGVARTGVQLDYLGVILLMWGATIPTVYYGFYKDPRLQLLYCSVVTFLAGLCAVTTFRPSFHLPSSRPYRAAMFASLGLSALVFIAHGVILHGYAEQNRRMSLDWMGLMAVLNLTGAFVYAADIPERLAPEKFDIFGSGHQILHFMVIFAGLAHMKGLFRAFDHAHRDLDQIGL